MFHGPVSVTELSWPDALFPARPGMLYAVMRDGRTWWGTRVSHLCRMYVRVPTREYEEFSPLDMVPSPPSSVVAGRTGASLRHERQSHGT